MNEQVLESVTLLKLFLYVSFREFISRSVFSKALISFSALRILASKSSPSLCSSSFSCAAFKKFKKFLLVLREI